MEEYTPDVTVVMHTYNRPEFFEHYVKRGLWDGVPMLIVDDGSDEAVVQRLQQAAHAAAGTVHHYYPNRGVAHATAEGIRRIPSDHFMLVGDDDFFVDYHAFAPEAAALLREEEDTLLVTMPEVQYLHGTTGKLSTKYDRRDMAGLTGLDLLQHFVMEGELYVFQAGSMMRKADALDALAEPFFRVSEDFVLMARLFARFPERKVRVMEQGKYVRLVHDQSLSMRGQIRPENSLIHLVSMCVGAKYLIEQGRLTLDGFRDVLIARGKKLQDSYLFGEEAVHVLGDLLAGQPPNLNTPEAVCTASYYAAHLEALPPEFHALLSEEGRAFLMEVAEADRAVQQAQAVPALQVVPPVGGKTLRAGYSVILPTYNRVEHFEHNLGLGYWKGAPLHVVDDGSRAEIAQQLDTLAEEHGFTVHHSPRNQGVSQALLTGVAQAETTHVVIVGDDDYIEDLEAFLEEAHQIWETNDDVLLVATPTLYKFDEKYEELQYDREAWAGQTGKELLDTLLAQGEMRALGAGTMFRTEGLESVMGDPFFRMAGDFAMLCRLCARYPDRKVYTTKTGCYRRLIHNESITAREKFTPEKAVMHLISIAVGGYHALQTGAFSEEGYRDLIWKRGEILQLAYGLGALTAYVLCRLLAGLVQVTSEGEEHQALAFLQAQAHRLPAEFLALLPAPSLRFLHAAPQSAYEETVTHEQPAPDNREQERLQSLAVIIANVQEQAFDAASAGIAEHKAAFPSDPDLSILEATIAIEQGDLGGAISVLSDAQVEHPDQFGPCFVLGNILFEVEEYEAAARQYARAQQIADEQQHEMLEPVWTRLRMQGIIEPDPGPRLAIIVKEGMDNFLGDITRGLVPDYQVRKFVVTGTGDVAKAMKWADICWFEWCNEPLIYGSNYFLARQKKIVCRLHRYEVFTEYPQKVNWEHVDQLILVTPHLKLILEHTVPGIEEKVAMTVVNNGVDLSKYTFRDRVPGFSLAYIGYLHLRKNPMMLLQVMAQLVAIDPRYKLFLAGKFQDALAKLYWEHMVLQMGLTDNVQFDGWQEDISGWLEDKNYLLSTSIHESFGYAIAEGMARGLKPVVHNFPFADEIWAEEMLFNTVDEAVAMVTSPDYHSAAYRAFIETHYGLARQITQIRRTLAGLLATEGADGRKSVGAEAFRPTITGFAPAGTNTYLTLTCGSCETSFEVFQGTIGGVAVGVHPCPHCGVPQEVMPDTFRAAIETRYQGEEVGDMVARNVAAVRIAKTWHGATIWKNALAYEGVNLGEAMAFDVLPWLLEGIEQAESLIKAA